MGVGDQDRVERLGLLHLGRLGIVEERVDRDRRAAGRRNHPCGVPPPRRGGSARGGGFRGGQGSRWRRWRRPSPPAAIGAAGWAFAIVREKRQKQNRDDSSKRGTGHGISFVKMRERKCKSLLRQGEKGSRVLDTRHYVAYLRRTRPIMRAIVSVKDAIKNYTLGNVVVPALRGRHPGRARRVSSSPSPGPRAAARPRCST